MKVNLLPPPASSSNADTVKYKKVTSFFGQRISCTRRDMFVGSAQNTSGR